MSNRLHEIPPPAYYPPMPAEDAEAMRQQQIQEAELRASERLLDDLGRELADPTPMEPPVGYNPQPTLVEQMRLMIQGERMRLAALEAGMETFEEADDFDLDEDPFPSSPHEDEFSNPLPARELRKREKEAAAAARLQEQNATSGGATSTASVTEPAPPAQSAGVSPTQSPSASAPSR